MYKVSCNRIFGWQRVEHLQKTFDTLESALNFCNQANSKAHTPFYFFVDHSAQMEQS